MPGDCVSGMEVRRTRPEDPDPGVGLQLCDDGEGSIVRGEERHTAGSRVRRRARPDYPDPGVGQGHHSVRRRSLQKWKVE